MTSDARNAKNSETAAGYSPGSASHRIPSLDGMRAVAIALVLLAHGKNTIHVHSKLVNALLSTTADGVQFFFVISGFLITTLLLNEQDKTGRIDLRGFYLRRAFRILPAFYTMMLTVAALWALGIIHLSWNSYLPALVFLRDYRDLFGTHLPVDDWFIGHTWSLSIEEQFYLLWPLSVLLLKPKKATGLALALLVADPFIRLAQYFVFPQSRDSIPIMLHTRMDSLMAGCLVALLIREEWFQRALQTAYRMRLPAVAAVFVFIISPILDARFKGIYFLPVGWTLENLSACLLMLWAIEHSKSVIGNILNSKFFVHVGVISYSLYLWQQFFLTPLNTTLTGRFPVNLLCVFAMAECSYFLIEKPFLALRRKSGLKTQLADVPLHEETAVLGNAPPG